jgi:hypothetical protein
MSHLESLDTITMRSESEILAAPTFTTQFLEVLDGNVELLDPWDYFAIRDYEMNWGCPGSIFYPTTIH